MLKQVKFLYEGKTYFTIFGCKYIMGKFPGSNALYQTQFAGDRAMCMELNRSNGGLMYSRWPQVDVEDIHVVGTYICLKGTVEFEGVKYNVEMTPDELKITSTTENEAVKVEEATVEVEEATVEVEEPVVVEAVKVEEPEVQVEEPTSAPEAEVHEPVIEEEQVTTELKDVEEVPVIKFDPPSEPMPDIEPLEEDEVIESIVDPETITPTVPDSHIVVGKTSRNYVRFGALPANPAAIIRTPQIDKPPVVLPTKDNAIVGCRLQLGSTFESGIHLGVDDKKAKGVTFGPLRSHSVQKPGHVIRAEKEAQRAARRQIEEEAQAAEAKRLQEAWNNTPANGFTFNVPTPVDFNPDMPKEEVIEDLPVEEVTEDNTSSISREEAKAAVRAELPKEINDVIGHIPVNMLGSIAECTYHPVNTVELAQKRNMYCIDNRWFNQGKWFCVDVIPNVSRYFYNAKLGISIEIPINICKAWLNALSV